MILSLVLTCVSPPVHGPGFVPAFQVTFKFNVFFSLTPDSLFLLDIDVTSHTRHKSLHFNESDRLVTCPYPVLNYSLISHVVFRELNPNCSIWGASDIGPVLRYSLGFFYPINGYSSL